MSMSAEEEIKKAEEMAEKLGDFWMQKFKQWSPEYRQRWFKEFGYMLHEPEPEENVNE